MISFNLGGHEVKIDKEGEDVILSWGDGFKEKMFLNELRGQKLVSVGLSEETLYIDTPLKTAAISGSPPLWFYNVKERR